MSTGLRSTEIGLLPEDWEVVAVNRIGTPVRGGSPRPAGDPRYFNGHHIPWLTVAALTNIPESQLVVMATATCLTEEGSLRSRTLMPGTLIIANSGATLGVAKILGIKCCANDGIAALLNISEGVSPQYLAYFLNSQTEYLRDAVATGNGQPNLNTTLIGNLKIPIPPTLAEQDAIAGALSDADALTASLEQLITKKRLIKDGARQSLLSGRCRLSGFAAGWDIRPFGEVARPRKERVDSRRAESHEACFELEHLEQGSGRLLGIGTTSVNSSLKTRFQAGDVLFGKLRAYLRKYWFADRAGLCSTEIWALEAERSMILPQYLYQVVQTNEFIKAASEAYGTHMPRSDWKVVGQVEVGLPSLGEQDVIAQTLADMEAEIAALEERLAKTRLVKQGMMQRLLTRIVHWPAGEEAAEM